MIVFSDVHRDDDINFSSFCPQEFSTNICSILEVVALSDLEKMNSYDVDELAFKYDQYELSQAILPTAFRYVFEFFQADVALYFSYDVWITDSLFPIVNLFQNYYVVTTPTMVFLVSDNTNEFRDDMDMFESLDAGFLGLKVSNGTHRYLNWWSNVMRTRGEDCNILIVLCFL
jgi:hypothetical protein